MSFQFQENSQFALLAVNDTYKDLPDVPFQLSDGTWILPDVPAVDDLGSWEKSLGSIRLGRLEHANLVFLVQEPLDYPGPRDAVQQRLAPDLRRLLHMLYLHVGLEISEDEGADLLGGSSWNGVSDIQQVSSMPQFYRSQGRKGNPITRDWLEDSLVLRAGYAEMKANETQFRRVIYGLNTLFKGLKEKTGEDRLHQFVRALEALIRPEKGKTKDQFKHRCQTFTRESADTHDLLSEAYDMRSATEHLNPWEKALQSHPPDQREDVYWQRTRQIEHLACEGCSRLLRKPSLRVHFRTEFWELSEDERLKLWGAPLDITQEPLVQE